MSSLLLRTDHRGTWHLALGTDHRGTWQGGDNFSNQQRCNFVKRILNTIQAAVYERSCFQQYVRKVYDTVKLIIKAMITMNAKEFFAKHLSRFRRHSVFAAEETLLILLENENTLSSLWRL